MEKATTEMGLEVDKMKDSVDQEDIQQSMNYLQNFLHLQSTIMGCLGKALDAVLDTSVTLASNMLLNKRDNCIPDAKRGYYGFIIVVVRALVRVRRDFLLATYSPHFFPDVFHIWQVA